MLKQFCLPNGLTEVFFIDEGKDSVQIFALTQDKNVILVKQFRAGTEKEEYELPGGGVEQNEDLKEAAKRELQEETGHVGEIQFLCSLPYGPYSTGLRHTFIATSCNRETKNLDLDPNEFLSVNLIPLEKFRDLIKTGQVRGFDVSYMALDKLNLLT